MSETISEEDIEKVNELITGETLNKSIERLPDEVIGDVRTYCFEIVLNGDDVVSLMKEAEEIWEMDLEERLDMEEEKEIRKAVKEVELKICSGRQDKLMYKMELSTVFESEGTTIDMYAKSEMSDYNSENIVVEKPADAKDFMETLEELFATPQVPIETEIMTYGEFKQTYGSYVETEAELEALYEDYKESMTSM